VDSPRSTIELEHPDQRRVAQREYVAERIGWGLLAVILVAALVGLLGPGLLSWRTRASQDGQIAVEYSALARYEAPAELIIHCPGQQASPVRIRLARTFTDKVAIESISPEPDAVAGEGSSLVYDVRLVDPPEWGAVRIRYRHTSYGRVRYNVRLGDPENGSSVQITQFVFP
jgi:hypothetical protein